MRPSSQSLLAKMQTFDRKERATKKLELGSSCVRSLVGELVRVSKSSLELVS